MTLPASGTISLSAVQSEFGGSNPVGMDEYYRGGSYVSVNNTSIPTSGTISLSNYYNGAKYVTGVNWWDRGTVASWPTDSGWVSSVDYGNGLTFLSGGSATYAYSSDGNTWTVSTAIRSLWGASTSGTYNTITQILWTGSYYIAAGSKGYIARSTNGTSWTNITTLRSTTWGTTTDCYALATNGSRIVVVGQSVHVAYSDDNGANWTYVTLPSSSNTLESVAWNGSVFCAVGEFGTCFTSPDGATWTANSGVSTVFGGQHATYITAFGSTFVAGSSGPGGAGSSNAMIATSTNGVSWTYRTALTIGSSDYVSGIATNGSGQYVAVTYLNNAATSSDLVTWTTNTNLSSIFPVATTQDTCGLAWNGTRYITSAVQFSVSSGYTLPVATSV